MAEKTRTCPECNGQMLLRLGEYQCQSCSHTLVPGADKEDEARAGGAGRGRSGGSAAAYGYGDAPHKAGERKATLGRGVHDPGAEYRANPPKLPMTGGILHGNAPDGIYSLNPHDRMREVQPEGMLRTEKHIWFGLYILSLLINTGSAASMGVQTGDPIFTVAPILGLILGIALYWYVLYQEVIWMKYCCGGVTLLNMVWLLWLAFSIETLTRFNPQFQALLQIGGWVVWFAVILGMAYYAWFISIIYRDIQRVTGG